MHITAKKIADEIMFSKDDLQRVFFPLLKVNVYPAISHFHVWRILFSEAETDTRHIR